MYHGHIRVKHSSSYHKLQKSDSGFISHVTVLKEDFRIMKMNEPGRLNMTVIRVRIYGAGEACKAVHKCRAQADQVLTDHVYNLSYLVSNHVHVKTHFLVVVFSRKTDTMEDFLSKEVVSPLLKLVSEGEVERGIAVAAAFVSVRWVFYCTGEQFISRKPT